MKQFLLLLALCLPVSAQDGRGQQVEASSDFFGGLNSSYPSSIIQPNQAKDMQNVFVSDGFVEKRGGSRKQNNTQIGGGSDVNAVYEYKKSNGTDYCVTYSSSNGYYSTDNCATFTSFFSSFTVNSDMNCVPFTDRLYCVNGVDTPFYFDGAAYKVVTGMPAGKYLRAYQNRLWLGLLNPSLRLLHNWYCLAFLPPVPILQKIPHMVGAGQ